jgi:dimethylaniline monooxygenase (N-oxide forming)
MKDFWDVIAKNVQAYRNDVSGLNEQGVVLEDGSVVPCDILLLGTGFLETFPFFDSKQAIEMGLSHIREDSKEEAEWTRLYEAADQQVITDFPALKDSPGFELHSSITPHRLYNCIAPVNDDTVAFVGFLSLANMIRGAEVQALWATAYLDHEIELPSIVDRKSHISIETAWSRRRYPFYGRTGIAYDFEVVGYTDRLLQELGLTSHLRGWWAYWTRVCDASELRGCIEEYKLKLKKQS